MAKQTFPGQGWDDAATAHAGTPTGRVELETDLADAIAAGDVEREIALATALARSLPTTFDEPDEPGGPSPVPVAAPEYVCPPGYDPEWFDRLQPHQQRDLAEDGTLTVRDAGDDPVALRPGIIDEDADWAYKRGQCLALAVAMSEQTGCDIFIQRVDHDDVDENDEKFYNLGHAYLRLPEGELLDIQGVHDEEMALTDEFGLELDTGEQIEPLVFPAGRAREALTHFDGYIVEQDITVAETFAKRTLAEYRLGTFEGRADYDAIGPDDAKALIDRDLRRRYTQGDCGVLAHHLAEQNGWGVCVVGHYTETDYGDGYTSYDTEQIIHAYSVRPDGNLVDVTGVHSPMTARELGDQWGAPVHHYSDAKTYDEVWNHEQWLDGDRWDDSYEGEDDTALAAHTARLVTIAYEGQTHQK